MWLKGFHDIVTRAKVIGDLITVGNLATPSSSQFCLSLVLMNINHDDERIRENNDALLTSGRPCATSRRRSSSASSSCTGWSAAWQPAGNTLLLRTECSGEGTPRVFRTWLCLISLGMSYVGWLVIMLVYKVAHEVSNYILTTQIQLFHFLPHCACVEAFWAEFA